MAYSDRRPMAVPMRCNQPVLTVLYSLYTSQQPQSEKKSMHDFSQKQLSVDLSLDESGYVTNSGVQILLFHGTDILLIKP